MSIDITELETEFFDYIEGFTSNLSKLEPGQICYVPTFFLEPVPKIFETQRGGQDKTSHNPTAFKISALSENHFRSRTKLPVRSFPAADKEEHIISKAKKRPCIFISQNEINKPDSETRKAVQGKVHQISSQALFLPLYSTSTPQEPRKGFPSVITERTKKLQYPQFFFIKQFNAPKSKIPSCLINDSLVRLDYLMSANLHHPTIIPYDIKLKDSIYKVLLGWLALHQKIPLSSDLETEISELVELFKDD